MESLFLLIPLSLATLAVAVAVFFRMSGTGQFEEGESPGRQVLLDDDRVAETPGVPSADPASASASATTPLPGTCTPRESIDRAGLIDIKSSTGPAS